MNQVAQSAVNCVVHTAEHHQGYAATRKRPEKSLRSSSGCAGNLIVFSDRQTPAVPMRTRHAEPALPAHQASAAPSAISQQVLASCAANHDQRDCSSGEPLTATKLLKSGLSPSTFVKALAGLVVIAVGVTWVAAKSATPEPDATSETAFLKPAAGGQASSGAVIPLPSAETTYARAEEDYLEELDWLADQNRFLQAEVEMLTAETLELNRELLDMELQLAIQHQIVEPSTEKRIVYNFVDVPVGTKLSAITENSESEFYEPSHLTDKVLSYDPDTGFHLNGQFNGASDAHIEDLAISGAAEQTQTPEKITYPPIASSRSK